tara:strand:+ start:133 stop:507 length:375 start_codon:yes stop_codon:yes gene_type:complete
MEKSLGRILSIKYYPREETVGFKEPPLLQVLRDGAGDGTVYELKDSYEPFNCPEDVYLFIQERCSKPFYEADYAFCLESVFENEFDSEWFVRIKKKALQMQADLTKEQKKASITFAQSSITFAQ